LLKEYERKILNNELSSFVAAKDLLECFTRNYRERKWRK